MAELGVAGSAVGVISLGIQICSGLINYYQDFKSQHENISATLTNLEHLVQTLVLLEATLSRHDIESPLDAAILEHFRKLSSHTYNGVKKLQAILDKFSHSEATNIREKLHGVYRKTLYPLQKKTIQELGDVVDDLRSNINLALQVVQTYGTRSQVLDGYAANLFTSHQQRFYRTQSATLHNQ
jgi:hypothetical protein